MIRTNKTIENLDIRATLLKSEYQDIVLKTIDKSILLHAPFIKSKSNINLILKGWNEYFDMYLEKKGLNTMKKKVNTVLTKLDKENYLKFKEYNSYIQKK